jgi:hypothetical protein
MSSARRKVGFVLFALMTNKTLLEVDCRIAKLLDEIESGKLAETNRLELDDLIKARAKLIRSLSSQVGRDELSSIPPG